MKKVVLKLEILDDRVKKKAMKNVSSLAGVESIAIDLKDKKLTVTGDVDPVTIVSKLRKICHTEIVSVGPAKEEGGDKKKEEEKKKAEEKKKEEEKKKAEEKKKEEDKKKAAYIAAYQQHLQNQAYPYYNYQQQQQQPYNQYNHPPIPYYSKVVHEETPNCVIC